MKAATPARHAMLILTLALASVAVPAWTLQIISNAPNHPSPNTLPPTSPTAATTAQKMIMTVPNVVGKTQAAAGTAIAGAMLVVGTVTQEYSDSVPAGSVILQTPPAGVNVAMNSAVNLVVSRGPQPIAVPDLSGKTSAEAQTALTAAGLVAAVSELASDTVPSGQVISQTPAPGNGVAPGATVTLVVSTGPANPGNGASGCKGGKSAFGLESLRNTLAGLFLPGLA